MVFALDSRCLLCLLQVVYQEPSHLLQHLASQIDTFSTAVFLFYLLASVAVPHHRELHILPIGRVFRNFPAAAPVRKQEICYEPVVPMPDREEVQSLSTGNLGYHIISQRGCQGEISVHLGLFEIPPTGERDGRIGFDN